MESIDGCQQSTRDQRTHVESSKPPPITVASLATLPRCCSMMSLPAVYGACVGDRVAQDVEVGVDVGDPLSTMQIDGLEV